MGRIGIIAGGGELPHIAMKEALERGEDPLFLAVRESEFHAGNFTERVIPIYITQIGNVIKICKKNQIDRLILLGKVNKDILLKSYKFDLKAILILAKMLNKNDYTFFEVVAKEFEKEKISILSQKLFLTSLLLPSGRYTKHKLSKKEWEDIEYGMNLASKLADLDIGQSVVVLDKMALALEAIEGTDECIRRGGVLSRKKGAVLCKSSKPNQDERFDLPTIGKSTLEIMHEYNYKTLAFRSLETIVVNPKEFIELAEKYKINIISFSSNLTLEMVNKKMEKV